MAGSARSRIAPGWSCVNMSFLPITSRCTQNCIFCSASKGGESGLKAWIGQVDRMPGRLVQISGGEPLTVPALDIMALLLYCRKKNKIVEFQTNATLLADIDGKFFADLVRMVKMTAGYFNVNYPAHTARLDEKITGTPGAYKKRREGCLRLIRAGAAVRLTHVINSLNYRFIEAFVKYAASGLGGSPARRGPQEVKRGISWIQFSFVKAIGRAAGRKDIVPRYSDAAPYLNRGIKSVIGFRMKCEVDHIPLCFVRRYKQYHVDYNKIMAGVRGLYLKEKRKIKACAGCGMSGMCAGPRSDYIDIYGGL